MVLSSLWRQRGTVSSFSCNKQWDLSVIFFIGVVNWSQFFYRKWGLTWKDRFEDTNPELYLPSHPVEELTSSMIRLFLVALHWNLNWIEVVPTSTFELMMHQWTYNTFRNCFPQPCSMHKLERGSSLPPCSSHQRLPMIVLFNNHMHHKHYGFCKILFNIGLLGFWSLTMYLMIISSCISFFRTRTTIWITDTILRILQRPLRYTSVSQQGTWQFLILCLEQVVRPGKQFLCICYSD